MHTKTVPKEGPMQYGADDSMLLYEGEELKISLGKQAKLLTPRLGFNQ